MTTSEQVERALELYKLIFLDNQATDSRRAELARLTQEMDSREAIKYYDRVRPLVLKLSMSTLLKQAAEQTEWS